MKARTLARIEWTEVIMEGWKAPPWSWDMDVAPKPAQVKVEGKRLTLTLAPKSVTVIGVRP